MKTSARQTRVRSLALALSIVLSACGGSDGDGGDASPSANDGDGTAGAGMPDPGTSGSTSAGAPGGGSDDAGGTSPETPPDAPIAGDIALYGIVAVGDEGGEASDLLATFSRLSTSVGPAAFGDPLADGAVGCRVRPTGPVDVTDLGVLYLPVPTGVSLEPIDAGETVLLSTSAGDGYATLEGRAADTFYTVSSDVTPPSGPVPTELVADVPGGDFPAFAGVALPAVETLAGASPSGLETITRDTRFVWEAGGAPGARIRIESSTAGGFFLDDSVDVDCLVADTG